MLALHAGISGHSLRQHFVTVNEVGHIPAGISHWQAGHYSFFRVNPPLPSMLAVLPVLLAQPNTDCIYSPADDGTGGRIEWVVGPQFAAANAPHYFQFVCLARLAGIAWSLLGGWIIYRWAHELYGPAAGCLGLTLWCFEPNILAHAGVVTNDLPATVAGLMATYAFWHYLRQPSWPRASLAGLLLGIAQLTKFTLLVLYAVWPVLWLISRLADRRQPGTSIRLATQVWHGLLLFVLSLLVINAGYEFQQSGRPLGDFPFSSRTFAGADHVGNRFRDSWLGHLPVPLPADYVRGIDIQRGDLEGKYWSYLAGRWQDHGWWYYYLHALAVKLPLGIWALILWSLILALGGHASSARWRDELTLWLPALAILGLVSSQTGFNHHLRYALPFYPFLLISTSKVAYFLQPKTWLAGILVSGLLLWFVGSSLAIHPHYLSYFNALGRGPDNGHNHLVDSNIDWGQDLLFLETWLDQHPEARPLHLAYWNSVDPRIIGIEFTLPPFGPAKFLPDDPAAQQALGPHPGYYAVSVNYVRGSWYIRPQNGKGVRVAIPQYAYEYFRHFRPIAKAGYSIFIYHITLDEANAVRQQLGLPPLTQEPPAGEPP
jgi:hypothetical protein